MEKELLLMVSSLISKMPKEQRRELLSNSENMKKFALDILKQLPEAFSANAISNIEIEETINYQLSTK